MREFMANPNNATIIGRQGENLATKICFPIIEWLSEFGVGGTFFLIHKDSVDVDPYPCPITYDENFVYWAVRAEDLRHSGIGQCELRYEKDSVVVKTKTFLTLTLESLGPAGETPPQPYQDWMDAVAEKWAEIEAILPSKQDRLTAGPGIEIDENNIITAVASAVYWNTILDKPELYTKAEIEELIDTELNEIDETTDRAKYYPYEIYNMCRKGKIFTYNGRVLTPTFALTNTEATPETVQSVTLDYLFKNSSLGMQTYSVRVYSDKIMLPEIQSTYRMMDDAQAVKLAGIETRADKTNFDNVKSAGAVMGVKLNGAELTKDSDGKVNVFVDVSAKEDKANKVTTLSASSTDDEYPSAKCVYDLIGDVETLLGALL